MKLSPGTRTDLYIESTHAQTIKSHLNILKALLPIQEIHFDQKCKESFSSTSHVEKTTITIPMPGELIAQEKERLQKEEQKKLQNIEILKKKLSNESFIERTPAELVEKQRELLKTTVVELKKLREKLQLL